ncbi:MULTISPECIES: hypothetical protein [Mycobacterium]|uniref:Uncharacterized protein n=1 Tax=Mycobacterium kyorinense TaxID=487514 RepID=A0A1X1XX43_9MYCO|nr:MULTISPECIES: hypothetical protein [Mycobacterium]ORW03344.1 hypothetical protein AWC14_05210 [Mycobacterium kyorinense]PBJ66603.1 hypothetical protein BB737_06725 [Mycobacterium avium subsp. hominissuis]
MSGPFKELIQNQAKILRIDLRDDNYWWSTRMFLVAALAQDYTQVEALVFVRSGNEQNFVGIAAPRDVRRRLAKNFAADNYESAYRKARAAVTDALEDHSSGVSAILNNWQYAVDQTLGDEGYISHIVSSSKLRLWMRGDLDTQSVPAGPLTAHRQYRIIAHDRRYVALTNGIRLEGVVDRDELVVAAQMERRVGGAS